MGVYVCEVGGLRFVRVGSVAKATLWGRTFYRRAGACRLVSILGLNVGLVGRRLVLVVKPKVS